MLVTHSHWVPTQPEQRNRCHGILPVGRLSGYVSLSIRSAGPGSLQVSWGITVRAGQVSWGITVRAQDRAGVMGYHSEGTGQVSWGITVRAQGRAGVMGYHSEGTGQVSWGITVRAQGRCHGVSQ